MKKFLAIVTVMCLLVAMVSCGGSDKPANTSSETPAPAAAEAEAKPDEKDDSSTKASGKMVLYSTMTENDLEVLLGLLEVEFPDLNIEVVNGNAGELTARIEAEKNNPQGDMMWGGLDSSTGDQYTEIFEHWLSDYEDTMPEEYKSPNGFFNMDHLSTAAFCVNTQLEEDLGIEINGYKDLLDPKLKGQILLADPASSSSAWNNLCNIMAVYGNDSEESWTYVEDLLKNGLVIASSSSACFKSVESGEYVVGLTYEDGIAALMKSGAENIKLIYPEEGTSASVFGTSVIKGAPNADNAKAVINYIMSPEGQKALGEGLSTLRMTSPQAIDSEYLPPTDSIKWVKRDVPWLTEHHDSIIEKWTDLYTSFGA